MHRVHSGSIQRTLYLHFTPLVCTQQEYPLSSFIILMFSSGSPTVSQVLPVTFTVQTATTSLFLIVGMTTLLPDESNIFIMTTCFWPINGYTPEIQVDATKVFREQIHAFFYNSPTIFKSHSYCSSCRRQKSYFTHANLLCNTLWSWAICYSNEWDAASWLCS